MASAALEAAGIPHVVFNVPAGPAVSQQDDQLTHRLTNRLPYNITMYCMSAFDMANLYLARGPEFFADQYRIGYWPWELPRFPALWKDVYSLVDEIWAGSTFTARSHRTQCTKPVRRLPCPVVIPNVKPVPRHALKLDHETAFVFVYPFDVNSHLARKNPLGLVRAFRLAFPPTDWHVALLLRVNGNPDGQPGWTEVATECAADPRITILAGTLNRQAALGVVAASDCLVSPHRAEGFGRNIAEAILLGVPVLATAFSGCMDFLAPEERLPFERTPVGHGEYPFGEGLWWAEPSVPEMARRMREVRRAREKNQAREARRLALRRSEIATKYSPFVTGKAFAARLRQIERRTAVLRSAS
jgi:glycosyltransferase involved in cell wall biosynthesis